jgi:AraC-like DNA-binding protein
MTRERLADGSCRPASGNGIPEQLPGGARRPSTADDIRFEAWRLGLHESLVAMETRRLTAGRFDGSIDTAAVGAVRISHVTADAQEAHRTPRLIARSDPPVHKMTVQLEGSCIVVQDGREAVLRPGDLAVFDCRIPYTLVFPDRFSSWVCQFPSGAMGVHGRELSRLAAQRISGSTGTVRVLTALIAGLHAEHRVLVPTVAERLSHSLLDMIMTVVSEQAAIAPPPPTRGRRLADVVRYIDEHLADPDLTLRHVAASQHISVRYAQLLFQEEGTSLTRWIREQRLDRCRRDLLDPRLADRPISAVAARWGLVDSSQFSKMFRAAYGESPRDVRGRATGTAADVGGAPTGRPALM